MNQLDELNGNTMEEGRDVNVIAKRIPVIASATDKAIPFIISGVGVLIAILGVISKSYILLIALVLPLFVWIKMANAQKELMQNEQKIQARASEIDNYMEQRVIILENLVKLLEKSIDVDKSTFVELAKYRSGNFNDENRNDVQNALNTANRNINVVLENYPDLRSQATIADAIQQNSYLQREITAARSAYNDAILFWNREIFEWPFKKIVASKNGYTTRIPFIATKEVKDRSREVFF